ncbi:hypothetical protein DPEC_G00218780 [Dallia pectoralis]|uniref:Uncharacterized protein n=1 Tax=Dallia pectoralis TaxID=75939 RepID=A0ACC2G3J1_DALPE|nr:hypothetical protein DPEC_G00218780 [Dallia pectoralis]
MANYCITCLSLSRAAELWLNRMVREEKYLMEGYTVYPAEVVILGKDQKAPLGSLAQMSMSSGEIQKQMSCLVSDDPKGNVLIWDTTHLSLYGGVQLDTCSWW